MNDTLLTRFQAISNLMSSEFTCIRMPDSILQQDVTSSRGWLPASWKWSPEVGGATSID